MRGFSRSWRMGLFRWRTLPNRAHVPGQSGEPFDAFMTALGSLVTRAGLQPDAIVKELKQSCTSGRAGGLICEPLKAVWPAYAGICYLFPYVLSNLVFIPPHR